MKTITDTAPNLHASQDQAAVNLDGFREAACGEEAERIELLKMYAGQVKLRLPQAQAAFEKRELPEIGRVLHSLTGATFTCGLDDFGTSLRSLEQSAKIGDEAAVIALMPKVLDYAARVETAIASELARSGS
jgi:EAL domain-containing protein (putative c-di-GMP-specific phosphodiesterase class I)